MQELREYWRIKARLRGQQGAGQGRIWRRQRQAPLRGSLAQGQLRRQLRWLSVVAGGPLCLGSLTMVGIHSLVPSAAQALEPFCWLAIGWGIVVGIVAIMAWISPWSEG